LHSESEKSGAIKLEPEASPTGKASGVNHINPVTAMNLTLAEQATLTN
jgi:hypothetical protein